MSEDQEVLITTIVCENGRDWLCALCLFVGMREYEYIDLYVRLVVVEGSHS